MRWLWACTPSSQATGSASPVDVHHDRAHWGWELVSADGVPYLAGVDYALLSEDGRLREVTGFFEPAAQQSAA